MGCPVSQPQPDPHPLQPGLEALNDLYPTDELEELVRDGGPSVLSSQRCHDRTRTGTAIP